MTIVKKICDCCHMETDWLFEKPRIVIEGYTVNLWNGETELCRKCMEYAALMFNEYGEETNCENERPDAEKR